MKYHRQDSPFWKTLKLHIEKPPYVQLLESKNHSCGFLLHEWLWMAHGQYVHGKILAKLRGGVCEKGRTESKVFACLFRVAQFVDAIKYGG